MNWISENWVGILIAILGLYEIIARLVPSILSYSWLTAIMKVINAIIPDKSSMDHSIKTRKRHI